MKIIGETPLVSQSTDFILVDKIVIKEFKRFTEHNRLSRGLLLWLGFRQSFIEFDAQPRIAGEPVYSYAKLIHLAVYSFVQHSLFPLRVAGYLGLLLVLVTGPAVIIIFFGQYVFHSFFVFTGTAFLALFLLTLIGIVLMSLGLIALYIGSIHTEVGNRPLYVVRDTQE